MCFITPNHNFSLKQNSQVHVSNVSIMSFIGNCMLGQWYSNKLYQYSLVLCCIKLIEVYNNKMRICMKNQVETCNKCSYLFFDSYYCSHLCCTDIKNLQYQLYYFLVMCLKLLIHFT